MCVGETISVRQVEADAICTRHWYADDDGMAALEVGGTNAGIKLGTATVTGTSGKKITNIVVTVLPVGSSIFENALASLGAVAAVLLFVEW